MGNSIFSFGFARISEVRHMHCCKVLEVRNLGLTALFTKPPAEPFPALPGTIPVEQKSVHWLSMGAAGRNDLRRSFCTTAGRTAAL